MDGWEILKRIGVRLTATPRRTIGAALAATAVACLLIAVWQPWAPESREALYGGRRFRESELALLQTAFAARDLDDWDCRDGQVFVPRSRRNAYLQAVETADALPPELHAPLSPALSASLLDTREARAEKQRQTVQTELVRLIQAMRGVKEATVRYSEQFLGGLHRRTERRALVAVRREDQGPLSGSEIQTIQRTVVAAVAGLRPQDVTVMDLDHAAAWVGPPIPSGRQSHSPDALLEHPGPRPTPGPAHDRVASGAPDRRRPSGRLVSSARSRPPQAVASGWKAAIDARLSGLEGVDVSVELPRLSTPAGRPVVHVRGDTGVAVKLRMPRTTLRRHFGTLAADPSQLPQAAAEQLQPLVEEVTRRPTAVFVALKAAVTADAPSLEHPQSVEAKNAAHAAAGTAPNVSVSAEPPPAAESDSSPGDASGNAAGWSLGLGGLAVACWLARHARRGGRDAAGVMEPLEQESATDVLAARFRETPEPAAASQAAASQASASQASASQGSAPGQSGSDDSPLTAAPLPADVGVASPSLDPRACNEEAGGPSVVGDDVELWIETLERERPQVVAAALTQMPPPDAAAILEGMCDDLRTEVLRRIGVMGAVECETRRMMCEALSESLETRRRQHAKRAQGEAAVQAILAARSVADAELATFQPPPSAVHAPSEHVG